MKNNFLGKTVGKLDYLLIIGIWLLIFGKNALSQLMFVDYVPETYFSLPKMLFLNGFTSVFSLIDVINLILAPINLLGIAFQLSILVGMLVSYFYIKKIFKGKQNHILFSLLFALVFFFNPFVYSRIMIGGLGVLLSYILMPVYIFYLLSFFEKGINKKSLIKLVIAMTLVSLFSIHFFVINMIIFFAASFWFYLYTDQKVSVKRYVKYIVIFVILLVLLNAFWIQGIFSGQAFSKTDSNDQSSLLNNIPTVAKILGMSGFWREPAQVSTFDMFPVFIWYILLAFILISLLAGYYYFANEKRKKFFYTLFWSGLILAVGVPYLDYLPFFSSFKDNNKFVSLIVISYAYFLPTFFLGLKDKMKKLKFLPVLFLIALVILFSFPLIGLKDQVKPVDYPSSYSDLNTFFGSKEVSGKIIYLPWQNYLTYKWTEKSSSDGRISVPINQILHYPVIIGPDKWGKETELTSKISICIANKDINCLEENSVQFIIKDKCSTYLDKYTWLDKNNSKKTLENACIDVYEINNARYNRPEIPDRFLFGVIISILTLISMIFLLRRFTKHTATF